MPRPLRIEFENAYYHVMNRGSGRKNIYKKNLHREIFIELLAEANKIYGIELHSYCLMDNHYHLLIKTPSANLARAMRHINGVYTQRFNIIEKTDGPLFRGRYKAIIVSYNEYFLNVSRYIHLNPLTANLVTDLRNFKWSSYNYFINPKNKPGWLNTDDTITLLNSNHEQKSYEDFIKSGIDSETLQFYENSNTPSILGSKKFKEELLSSINDTQRIASLSDFNRTRIIPSLESIIFGCSEFFCLPEKVLLMAKRGNKNKERRITIYACRMLGNATLLKLSLKFGCNSLSNISKIILLVDSEINKNHEFKRLINNLFTDIKKKWQANT